MSDHPHRKPPPAPDPDRSSAPTGTPVGGRARLRAALRPRRSRGQLVAAVLCGVLGFAVAVQVRANSDEDLSGLRQTDLVRILDDVSQRASRLQDEARDLEDTRNNIAGGADGSRAALEEAEARARTLGVLAGTLPATGPGIRFTIDDPSGTVRADVLLDALQELRDAGAEAVALDDSEGREVRVVAGTYLEDATVGSGGGVVVDGTVLTPPYRFTVIGDPRTLAAALDIPGGVLDVLAQNNARGIVTEDDLLRITVLRAAPEPQYARPAPEESDDESGG